MLNVCSQCGMYRADKMIDPSGPFAICPECGYKHPFLYLPLLVVSGASGTGKTSVCKSLTGRYRDSVLLDTDILWQAAFDTPQDNYREFFETWLRVCKNISQSGRPVVLFGAGAAVPENLEGCVERRYFSSIRYLALVCSKDALAARLRQRPAWRGTRNPEYIEAHQRFNQWFIDYNKSDNHPPITVLDTSNTTLEETAGAVEDWIRENQNAA